MIVPSRGILFILTLYLKERRDWRTFGDERILTGFGSSGSITYNLAGQRRGIILQFQECAQTRPDSSMIVYSRHPDRGRSFSCELVIAFVLLAANLQAQRRRRLVYGYAGSICW